jgi:hypothetical protein
MIYQFKSGSRLKGDAQKVGERLEKLRKQDDCEAIEHLTAKRVVAEARPKRSPLHPYFEWRDDVAGELYREEQARLLTRSIVYVEVTEEDEEPKTYPVYVHATVPEVGSCYVTTEAAMGNEEIKAKVMAEALSGLRAWRRRYEMLSEELPAIFAAIEELDHAAV